MNKAKPETLLSINKPKRGETIAWYPSTNFKNHKKEALKVIKSLEDKDNA
jgi:hypothetical protein